MKNVTIYTIKACALYFMFILFSCGKQQETTKQEDSLSMEVEVVKSLDTIKKKYRTIDTDTLVSEKKILLNNESYNLKIIKYCSNDSAVINELFFTNNNGSDSYKVLDISHNYFEQIILSKGNEILFDILLSKENFKGLIDDIYYKRFSLYDIQYDVEEKNKLNFKATLVTPDSNWVEEFKFAIFYKTKKVGQLDFSKTEPDRIVYTDLKLYHLWDYNTNSKDRFGFVSMSDQYYLSEHQDSLAIPDLILEENGNLVQNNKYIKLESKYRKRFLTGLKISEMDKVFIFNYYYDTLVTYTVKNLNVVACLNVYANDESNSYGQSEYMFGFELSESLIKSLGEYYYESFVYVGKENPFIQGQLKPFVWGKITPSDFPSRSMSTKNVLHVRNLDLGNTYMYETADYQYFVQEYLDHGRPSARHLLVIDFKTKEIIKDLFDFESEGSSLAPLNVASGEQKSIEQWTGKLFKDKPQVCFGFEYISFGCPSITFLDRSVRDVYINCDNRH